MIRFICLFFCAASLSALSPSQALDRLMQGNKRFVQENQNNPNQSASQRIMQKQSQTPFAIIVACADSRVAPEILFDQGIGDLFVIRVAGNVVGPLELESIIFAAKYLNASCILVMGHQNCGAVNAVIQNTISDVMFTAQMIKPAVVKARAMNPPNLLKASIQLNAQMMSNFILESPTLMQLKSQGQINVYPAYYSFQSGVVTLLPRNY